MVSTQTSQIQSVQTDDIDAFRSHGRVFYRETIDPDILARATEDVLKYLTPTRSNRTFTATSAFIATWFRLTHYVFWRNDGNPVSTAERVSKFRIFTNTQSWQHCHKSIKQQQNITWGPLLQPTQLTWHVLVRRSLNCPLFMHCLILGLACGHYSSCQQTRFSN